MSLSGFPISAALRREMPVQGLLVFAVLGPKLSAGGARVLLQVNGLCLNIRSLVRPIRLQRAKLMLNCSARLSCGLRSIRPSVGAVTLGAAVDLEEIARGPAPAWRSGASRGPGSRETIRTADPANWRETLWRCRGCRMELPSRPKGIGQRTGGLSIRVIVETPGIIDCCCRNSARGQEGRGESADMRPEPPEE